MLEGIDVSNWQGYINWKAVRASGIKFAYLKATEGTTFVDKRYDEYREKATLQGIVVGAYHFGRPYSSAALQARNFLKAAKVKAGDLIPCLDIESHEGLSPSIVSAWIAEFAKTVKEETGVYPIIYVSPGWWNYRVANDSHASFVSDNCPLWVAHWGVSKPQLPRGWKTWECWQHTSDGEVNGIGGRVDKNYAPSLKPIVYQYTDPTITVEVVAGSKTFKNVSLESLSKLIKKYIGKVSQIVVRKSP